MNFRSGAAVCLFTTFIVASCATKTTALRVDDSKLAGVAVAEQTYWAGRIGLQISSEPPQAFFAGFELNGRPERGSLLLLSPLGSTLGVMRWAPSEASLEQGTGLKKYASVDELLFEVIGAAVPLSALFDWLVGTNGSAPGWTADLSQQANGRINAKRISPLPQADLRIVLDKSP